MTIERAILCGSVREDSLSVPDGRPVRLRRWGARHNVELTIADVRQAMWREVPRGFEDLIDIATNVYCADQAIPRGGNDVENFGENWRRRLFFRIPVREVDLWRGSDLQGHLIDTLSFLSEDEYHFEFEPLTREPPLTKSFTFTDDPLEGTVDEVMLFSVGLDSTAGAVQEAVLDRRQVVLVHHRFTPKYLTVATVTSASCWPGMRPRPRQSISRSGSARRRT
jgi:hypothetical protein